MAWREKHHGSYRVCWRDPSGKKLTKGGFQRAKDADAFKLEVERRELLGGLYEEKAMTFGEFAGLTVDGEKVRINADGPDTWFGRYKREVATTSYWRRRDSALHLRDLIPLTFQQITPNLLDELYVKVGYEHPRTAVIVAQTVKMVLRAAKVRGQRVNVEAIDVKAPRYSTGDKIFLTREEVEGLADASDDARLANIIRFAALTGLRLNEIFSLTDMDVTLGDRAVVVRKSKTKAGERTVPLIEEAREVIRAQRANRPNMSTYLFPAPMGGKQNKDNFSRSFRKLREKMPVGHPLRYVEGEDENAQMPFHALRHTFATLMIGAGIQPKVLQTLMGHASISVTMDTYGHLYDGATEAAMLQFENFLKTKEKDERVDLGRST